MRPILARIFPSGGIDCKQIKIKSLRNSRGVAGLALHPRGRRAAGPVTRRKNYSAHTAGCGRLAFVVDNEKEV